VSDSPRATRSSTRPPSLRNSRTVTSAMLYRITGETTRTPTAAPAVMCSMSGLGEGHVNHTAVPANSTFSASPSFA
jgi:hypothetical protein